MTELSALSQSSDLATDDNLGLSTNARPSLDLVNDPSASSSHDFSHWATDPDPHRTDLGPDPLGDASQHVLPTDPSSDPDFALPVPPPASTTDLDSEAQAPSLPPSSLPTPDDPPAHSFTDPLDPQVHDPLWQSAEPATVHASTDNSEPLIDSSQSQGAWPSGPDSQSLLAEFNGLTSATAAGSQAPSATADELGSSSLPLPLPLPLPSNSDLTTSSAPMPSDFSFIDSSAGPVDDSLHFDLTSDPASDKDLPTSLTPPPLNGSSTNEMHSATALVLSPGPPDPVELSAFSPRRATSGSGQSTTELASESQSWSQPLSNFGLSSQPNGHALPQAFPHANSEALLSHIASMSGIPAQVLSDLHQQLATPAYSRRGPFPGYSTFDPNATAAAARPPPVPTGPGPIDLTDDEPVEEITHFHAPRKTNSSSSDVHTVSEHGRQIVVVDDENEQDDEDDVFAVSPRGAAAQSDQGDHLYGAISSFIVGTKYCYAVVQPGETVYLQRDKSNPFDVNTHAVVNKIGSRAGFLARETNAILAPLLFSDSIRVEVTVQSPAYDDRLPINIAVYGSFRDRIRIEHTLSNSPISYMPGVAVSPIYTARFAGAGAGAGPVNIGMLGTPITQYNAIGSGPTVSEIETNLDKYFENAAVDFENIPESDAKLLQTPLHPYQKQGLYWMMQKEGQTYTDEAGKHLGWEKQTRHGRTVYINKATNVVRESPPTLYRGGVLADEMGLGKTLQVLALIMSNSGRGDCVCGAAAAVSRKLASSSASASSSSGAKASKGSSKSSKPTKKRQKTPHDSDSDSSDSPSPSSQSGANEHSAGSCARPSGPTLIVCPLSVITNWQDQIETHVLPDHCSFYTYHGPNRMKDPTALATFDVVITTYTVLSTEFVMPASEKKKKASFSFTDVTSATAAAPPKETKSRKRKAVTDSPLFAIDWLRVVLDEAHIIRDPKTRQSLAAAALRSSYRWSVTGTPFQNKVDDAFALLRFLQLEPFNVHTVWSKMIMKPLKNREEKGLQRLQNIMGAITLRRRKNESIHGKAILTLPTKTQRTRYVELHGEEKDLYRALATDGKNRVGSLLRSDQAMRHYAVVLEILLRMRQACDHVDLVPENYKKFGFANMSEDERAEVRRLVTLLEDSPEDDCSICLNAVEDAVVTPCGHFFCRKCLEQSLAATPSCPLCRQAVVWAKVVTSDTRKEIDLEEKKSAEAAAASSTAVKTSAKVDALIEEMNQSYLEDNTCKSVVFSQWTSMLDVLERCFKARGVGLVRLDGRMSASGRKHALRAFRDDPKVKVFLISLKAGGVGLNLTAGNKVYMMDPWWNPSAEDQAVDRVHRLGQTKPVEIVRFCVKGSIEEKIMELQNHKRKIMASAMVRLGKKRQESKDDRLGDLMFLFGERSSLTAEISGSSASAAASSSADPDGPSSSRSSSSSPPANTATSLARPPQYRSFEASSSAGRRAPSQSFAAPSPAPGPAPSAAAVPWADPRSAASAPSAFAQYSQPSATGAPAYWDPQSALNGLYSMAAQNGAAPQFGQSFPTLSAFTGGFTQQFPR